MNFTEKKLSYYYLFFLIPAIILLPKSFSVTLGIVPTRLFLTSVFVLLFIVDFLQRKIVITRVSYRFLILVIMLFLIATIPSLLITKNLIISIYSIIKFAAFFLFFALLLNYKLSKKEYLNLLIVFMSSLSVVLILGIFEYYFSERLFLIGIDQIPGARGRIEVSFFNTIYYGIFLNIALGVSLYLLRIIKGCKSLLMSAIIILIFLNITFTFTRTSFLVFFGILGLTTLLDINLLKKVSYIICVSIIGMFMFLNPTINAFSKYSLELPIRYLTNLNELILFLPSIPGIPQEPNQPNFPQPEPVLPDFTDDDFTFEKIELNQLGTLLKFDFSSLFGNEKPMTYSISSSDPSVIEVLNDTKIYVHDFGEVTLSLTTASGAIYSIPILVHDNGNFIKLTNIETGESNIRIEGIGVTRTLHPIFNPVDATDLRLTWTSSNPDVVTVDRFGGVVTRATGESTITAVSNDTMLTFQILVQVVSPSIDFSALHRKEFSIIANRIAQDHLFTGVGFGAYIDFMNSDTFTQLYPDYMFPRTHPHSALVLLFAETGIISVILMVLILLMLLIRGGVYLLRFYASNVKSLYISRYIPAILVGFLLVNVFAENAIYDTQVFPLFLLVIGLSFSYLDNQNEVPKKVIAIASQGGHIFELMQVAASFEAHDYLVITDEAETTTGLKNKYNHRIKYLKYETRKNLIRYLFVFSFNIIKSLAIYLLFMPDYILSTGTHTAVPMCYIGKIFGSRIIYIESMANINSKSLSGTLVYPIADLFIVQWQDMLHLYKKAVYGGLIIK